MSVLETIVSELWPVILFIGFCAVLVVRTLRTRAATEAAVTDDDAQADENEEDSRLDRLDAAFVIDAGHPRRSRFRAIGRVVVAVAAAVAMLLIWQPVLVLHEGRRALRFSPVEDPWNTTAVVAVFAAAVLIMIHSYGVLKVTVTGRDIDIDIERTGGRNGKVGVDHHYYDVTEVKSYREIDASGTSALEVTFDDGKSMTIRDPFHYEPLLDYLKRAGRLRDVRLSREELI